MISTVSTETDAVVLNKANGILIPSSLYETPIGSLTVSNSDGFHIGTKIVADTVTYVNEDHNNNDNKKEKKLLTNNIMIIVVATLLSAILIVIIVKNKSDIDNSGKKPFSDNTTPCPFVDPTTPSTTTPLPTTTEPTPPIPPDFKIVPYNEWSLINKLKCIKNTKGYTIALDLIFSYNCESSKDYLITYENKYSLKHNFYISGDDYVFEGYGWDCSSEHDYRYSRSVIKIAFFCLSGYSHTKLLQKLISYGIGKSELHKNYNIIPECCRDSNMGIIDNSTLDYLYTEAGKTFLNPTCIDYNPQCTILYHSQNVTTLLKHL